MDSILNVLGILALVLLGVALVLLVLAGVALFLGGKDFLKNVGKAFWERRFPSLTELSNLRRLSVESIPAVRAEPPAAVAPPSSEQALPAPASPSVTPQLRNPVPDFVGRTDHIETITACLRDQRGAAISAIGGQGGVGKTELAYYVAREVRGLYPDGQVQINLRGLDAEPVTPASAMERVLYALEPERKIPDDDQHLAGLYQGLLAERRVLILADNAKDSAQVAPLVPKPPSALLVTSRQPIRLPGVEAVDLEQLAPDEAANLLRKNLGEDRASDDEIARLAELCGYLPLALRAAGERLAGSRALSTPAYLQKLKRDRGDLRYQGKEVMAVLAGSVEALAQEQPELVVKWRSLTVFPAPFDRRAGEAVGELDAEGLEVLVSRNLVLFDDKEERFRLHDLFRDLAGEGLSDENEYAAAKRHSGHFLGVEATAGARHIEDKEGFFAGLRVFDRERAHIEAGQAWAAAHAEDDDEAALCAQGYPLRAAHILNLRQHPRDRIGWLETSAQAARKLGNRESEGMALGNLGGAYRELGETRKAIEYYEQHLAIARETGDRRGEGMALGNLGGAYGDLGETRKAVKHFEQHLAIARETGDRRGEGATLGNLGVAYNDLGETRKAIEYFEQHLAIARETGDRRGEANALHNRAEALDELGRRQEAIADAGAALVIFEGIEDPNAEQTRQMLARWGALPGEQRAAGAGAGDG